jgi:2-polyprenyl-6-hydroxyphenyl methylase/3-demethylubiquinone-9 3-methyltransferase
MNETTASNVDAAEVNKFDSMAARWWDTDGEFRPLHDLNPVRLRFIQQHADIVGKQVLDVGCGGGILSESMAHAGAKVVGIDAAPKALTVAKLHAMEAGIDINYQNEMAEDHAKEHAGQYDVVTCLELLEHVPDPSSLINACAQLLARWARDAQLNLIEEAGMDYNPILRGASLTRSVDINYLMCFQRPSE